MANKKNGGIIPPLPLIRTESGQMVEDERVTLVPIGCGKCMECMKQKSRGWQVRLLEDIRHNKNGIFVTLTFSDEKITQIIEGKNLEGEQIIAPLTDELKGYDIDNEVAKIAVRRFLERWRKKHKKSVRHWLVTELGHEGTENIHLHGIIWTDIDRKEIEEIWKYGFCWVGDENKNWVNEATVNYITKYINKTDFVHKEYQPRILTSAGIGKGYLDRHDSKRNKFNGKKTIETYTNRQGIKMNLPVYWRNKLYNEEERQRLWINKLDEETRWVGGEKVDVSKGDEKYYRLLEWYRRINKKLGYGDNKKNWKRKIYETERRAINQMKRIKGKVIKPKELPQIKPNDAF